MAGGGDTLNDRQEAVALSLARGFSVEKAAADAGVGERTVYTWRASVPAFKARVGELRGAMYGEATGRLAALVSSTVERLHQLSKSRNQPVALGACKAIMEHAARTRELLDLEERLQTVEEQLRQRAAQDEAEHPYRRNGRAHG